RYWYEAMPFLLLVAGRGLDLLGRLAAGALTTPLGPVGVRLTPPLQWVAPSIVFALLALYNVSQSIPFQASSYRDYNGISASALRNTERAGLKDALVFVELDPAKPNRDYGKVFFANDPLLKGNIVYARDLSAKQNKTLAAQFPARKPYWLPLDGPPIQGTAPPRARFIKPASWDR